MDESERSLRICQEERCQAARSEVHRYSGLTASRFLPHRRTRRKQLRGRFRDGWIEHPRLGGDLAGDFVEAFAAGGDLQAVRGYLHGVVGQAILPADALSSASRRRLKAGGSQDWLPHTDALLHFFFMVTVTSASGVLRKRTKESSVNTLTRNCAVPVALARSMGSASTAAMRATRLRGPVTSISGGSTWYSCTA